MINTPIPGIGLSSGIISALSENWDERLTQGRGVTIVICTYERPKSLIRALDSIHQVETTDYPVLLVDASRNQQTEDAVRKWLSIRRRSFPLGYVRVDAALRGLTRQRNLALRLVQTDLICFFDDDVVLQTDCVSEMQRVFRNGQGRIVGVGGMIVNQPRQLTALWRLRLVFCLVSNLRPGTYHGSGMSVPWGHAATASETLEGDWLPGAAMLWATSSARRFGFCEEFSSYSQAEDLEFSLRMGKTGVLAIAPAARLEHFHAPEGRENQFRLGYMAIRNRYYIHHEQFTHRRRWWILWFAYAWSLDTLMLCRYVRFSGRISEFAQHARGRFAAASDLLLRRPDRLVTASKPNE